MATDGPPDLMATDGPPDLMATDGPPDLMATDGPPDLMADAAARPHPPGAPDTYQPTLGAETIRLGRTDVHVSPLGVGTWAWGDRILWGYGRSYSDDDLQAAFRASLDAGITLFDTAEIYGSGQSERLIGRFWHASSAQPGDGHPALATKFFPYPWRLRRQDLLHALEGSRGRLGCQSVDLYQIHWPFPPVSIETWMEALADAVEAGLTRAVGVSNYNARQLRRAHAALARRGVPLASNQVHYSLLHRRPEQNGVLQACRELGVTLIAYSPLEMGVLTGKYTPAQPPPGRRRRRFKRDSLTQLQPLLTTMRQIGDSHDGKTPAQVALNWLICKGTLPIPGAKNARQAQDNAAALSWQLTPEEVEALDRLSAPLAK